MRRPALRILAAFAAFGAAPAATAATLADLDGAWIVEYVDHELGRVAGEAYIDADAGSVEVTYRDPGSGESRALRSASLTLEGDRLTIELLGRSPNRRRADGLQAPEIAYALEAPAAEISVRWGENSASLPLLALPETDRGRVTLELSVSDALLAGTWRYRSHRFLGRAADGWGRDGLVEVDESGVAWTIGAESWRRPQPVVYGALAIEDQLALTLFTDGTSAAVFPYPFGKAERPTGKSRHLFVFGKELPRDFRRELEIEAIDPGIEYVEVARQDEAADPYKSKFFADGFRRLRERLQAGPDADAAVADLDAIVLRADLSADAAPGVNGFRLNGQDVDWLLQFGDNTAQLRIVRAIGRTGGRYEATGYLFPGELVRVEIETAHVLPVESIPVIVGVDGRPLLLGDGDGIPAGRDADNPRIYRTDYIRLAPAAMGAAVDLRAGDGLAGIPVRQGSRVSVVLGRPGLISVPPGIAQATVFETAGDTGVGGDWSRWLDRAAECAGETGAGVALETATADEVSKLLIQSGASRFPIPGWMETEVSIGQHAAMLILRDSFVRLLENNRAQFARIVGDQEILAFRRHMEPLVRQGATPLTRIEVDRIGGGRIDFVWTFEKEILAELNDGRIDEVERWAIDATRQALGRYKELMAAASERARGIDSCDVEALLRLTGSGFEPVARIAKTKMMMPVPGLGLWVPDFRARAWIDTIALVGDRVRVQDKVAAEDRQNALMAVGLATIPVAIVGGAVGSAAAIVATAAVDVFDVAYGVYGEIDEKWAGDAEVAFAKGAADVLGMQRLARAEAEQRPWSTVFVRLGYVVGPAAVGLGLDIPDLFKAFREGFSFRKVARGRAAVLAMNDIDALAAGTGRAPEIERLVAEAIEESRAAGAGGATGPAARRLAEAAGRAEGEAAPLGLRFDDLADAADNTVDDIGAYLDDIGASALRADLDDLALEAARRQWAEDVALGFETPDWAANFRPGTFDELRRHLRRADVLAMAEAAAERLARQLDAADARRARLAREVLESEPGLDIAAFERRIDKLLERRAEPLGQDFYRQAAPDDHAIEQSLRDAGWTARAINDGSNELGVVIRDPDGRVGSVWRAYDANTGKLVMRHAFREFDWEGAVPGPIQGTIKSGLPVPLTPKGTPALQFFTLRIMNALKIPYGAANGIRAAEMSTILNARTIAQLNWYKRTYYPTEAWSAIPADDLSRALLLSHSGRYGAEALAFAGYRVKGARLELSGKAGSLENASMSSFGKYYEAEGGETFDDFLRRHGLEPDSPVFAKFDIVLEVEPW